MSARDRATADYPFPVLYNATYLAGNYAYSNTKKRNRFVNQVIFLNILQLAQRNIGNEPYAVIADAQYGEMRERSASWWELISRLPTEWRQKYIERLTPWYKNPNSHNNVTAWIVDMSGVDALVSHVYGKYREDAINKVRVNIPNNPNSTSSTCGRMDGAVWDYERRGTVSMKTFPACCGVGLARSISDPIHVARLLKEGTFISLCDPYGDWYNPSWSFVLIETDPSDDEYENNMEVIRRIKETKGIQVWSSRSYGGRRVHAVAMFARRKIRHVARRKERNHIGDIWR